MLVWRNNLERTPSHAESACPPGLPLPRMWTAAVMRSGVWLSRSSPAREAEDGTTRLCQVAYLHLLFVGALRWDRSGAAAT